MSEWSPGVVILGEYAIEKELGRGGMGRVWLVKSNSTGRRFAVKQALIRDDKHRKAFLTELQTWIDLPDHPNIVPCRFFRTVGDEIVIFADYVEGGSLADWIAKGKLTGLEQMFEVAIQFACGLHAIHERGLIHQDVKPGNVLMTPEGVPMVTDFGLARARLRTADGALVSPVPPPGQQSVLVSSGGMTPAYASPEQRSGKPLSRKTDIWSWGVSVLDMFVGGVSCPHGGHIALDILQCRMKDGPEDHGLPQMPECIAGMLSKCFLAEPEKRWRNLKDATDIIIHALEDVTGDNRHQLMSEGTVRMRRYVSPDPLVADGGKDPREWLSEVNIACRRNDAEPDNASMPQADNRTAADIGALSIYEECEQRLSQAIEEGKSDLRRLLAGLLVCKAEVLMRVGDAPGALRAFDQAILLLKTLVLNEGRLDLVGNMAAAYMNKAIAVTSTGDGAAGIPLFDCCISLLQRHVSDTRHNDLLHLLVKVYINKANAVSLVEEYSTAATLAERAIDILEGAARQVSRGEIDKDLASAYIIRGVALGCLSNPRSLSFCDKGIAVWERLLGKRETSEVCCGLANAYMNKSLLLIRRGDLGARLLCEKSIVLLSRLVEEQGRSQYANDLARACLNQAIIANCCGDTQYATECAERSIRLWERLVEVEGRTELTVGLSRARQLRALLTQECR